MLCEKCKQFKACYHSTLIVNGEETSKHLCEKCAEKEGVFKEDLFFDNFKVFNALLGLEDSDGIKCNKCGWTLREFKNSGLFGCEECYNAFSKEVEDSVRRIQPYEQHKTDTIEFNVQNEKKTQSKNQELTSLRKQLQDAIKDERYEDAGVINKKIKKLEKELGDE